MTATNQDVEVRHGDTIILEFHILDENGAAPAASLISTARWKVAEKLVFPAALQKDLGADLTIEDGVSDLVVKVTLSTTDTKSLQVKTHAHQLILTTTGGSKSTVSEGRFVVKPRIAPKA